MTQDEVIALAREAELYEDGMFFVCAHEELTRFAALIEAKLMERLLAGAGEPVAYLQPKCVDSFMRADLGYETCASSDYGAFSVYTADQTAAAVLRERESRKPLTDEQIDKLEWAPSYENPMTLAEGLQLFARAIEAAHGITGDKTC